MGSFQVRYDSRVVNYECKMFIRLAPGDCVNLLCQMITLSKMIQVISRCNTTYLICYFMSSCISRKLKKPHGYTSSIPLTDKIDRANSEKKPSFISDQVAFDTKNVSSNILRNIFLNKDKNKWTRTIRTSERMGLVSVVTLRLLFITRRRP